MQTNRCKGHVRSFTSFYQAPAAQDSTSLPESPQGQVPDNWRTTSPIAQSLPKLFKLANPKSAYSCLTCLSCKNHSQISGTCMLSSCSFCLLTRCISWCFPTWPCLLWPLLLGTVSNKLSFQWQSCPDLLAPPLLINSWTYFKRQERKREKNRGGRRGK